MSIIPLYLLISNFISFGFINDCQATDFTDMKYVNQAAASASSKLSVNPESAVLYMG